jgi:hypothetical protein
MRPHGNRVGTTNGGSTAEPFSAGIINRATVREDYDPDCGRLRLRSRDQSTKKRFGIRIYYLFNGKVRVHWCRYYRDRRSADQAVAAFNRRECYLAEIIDHDRMGISVE